MLLPGAGSTVQTPTNDAIVVRFDGDGNATSGGRWGGTRDDKIKSLSVDSAGNIYGVGSYGKEFGSIGSQLGLEDILVVGIKP